MQIVHSEYQDQLVRGLTHRMNNILTLFHGYLGLVMENKALDKATLDALGKIKIGATQATDLMERTHGLVRPTTTVLREIDLAEYLRLIRPSFDQHCGPRTTLTFEIDDDLPRMQGDATRVRIAIMELVKNACEATFATGGDVKLRVHSEQAKGTRNKWMIITVTDDGPGVPEGMQDKIFVPFFSTKKRLNSAGLGLSVAQSFVQQHGGFLRFESVPGSPTVFELRFPCVAEKG